MKTHFASNVMKAAVLAILCLPAMRTSAQAPAPQSQPPQPKMVPGDDLKALAAKPTPKTADGHPDLSGRWLIAEQAHIDVGGAPIGIVNGKEHILAFGKPLPGETDNDAVQTDNPASGEDRRKAREAINKPDYKPEFQAKVDAMGKDPNHNDPTTYSCQPGGVPRMGAPAMITQTPGLVVFLYRSSPYSTFRVIPTDGRPHRTGNDYDPNIMGDPVGHWEGDTLVIETTGFDDYTWFGQDGYFHTDAMRVIERFTRKGETLEYTATVEDPNVLAKPYNLNPATLKLGGSKDILYNDDYPCDASFGNFKDHADHKNHI